MSQKVRLVRGAIDHFANFFLLPSDHYHDLPSGPIPEAS